MVERLLCTGRAARAHLAVWSLLHRRPITVHGVRLHTPQQSPGTLHLHLPLPHERQGQSWKYGGGARVFFPPGAKVRGAALATVNTHPPCTERIINKYKLTLTHCNANAKSPNFRPSNADSCKVPPEAAALSRCNCGYFLC